VERFADQIRDELNIKKVTLHDPAKGPLLIFDVKLNPKSAGPKFGPKLAAVTAALAKQANAAELLSSGKPVVLQIGNEPVAVEPGDVWITPRVEKGWGGIADRGTQILLDGRITPELELEGLAREIVRHVQNARKDADLQMDDRIALRLTTDAAKLQEAIRVHGEYIAAETLVVEWTTAPMGGKSHTVQVEIEKMKLTIELKKQS
jgi:isoleucyl-tRNA synthetase